MRNYLVDTNPFNLAGPPEWFLRQLHDYDPSLVIIPSRQGFFYRLAQRRPLQLRENMTNDLLWQQSDTRMLARHSLVPITTIIATCNWGSPVFWQELDRRAPWKHGGVDAFEAKCLAQDDARDAEKAAQNDDRLTCVAKDGWGMYRKKAGFRTSAYVPRTKSDRRPASKGPAIIIP